MGQQQAERLELTMRSKSATRQTRRQISAGDPLTREIAGCGGASFSG
jgi:hypothetical protein